MVERKRETAEGVGQCPGAGLVAAGGTGFEEDDGLFKRQDIVECGSCSAW
jgi:hypothetical protein